MHSKNEADMSTDEVIDRMRMGKRIRSEGIFEALLPFEYSNKGNQGIGFYAYPQRIFKPRGLAIWGAPAGAVVRQVLIGIQMQLVAAYGSIPARFFSYGQSYEQIAKLLDEGIEPATWGQWDTARPGNLIQIIITDSDGGQLGPEDGIELCMWGHAVTHV